jgi:hypothetical protein
VVETITEHLGENLCTYPKKFGIVHSTAHRSSFLNRFNARYSAKSQVIKVVHRWQTRLMEI